ncbi:hypothetical protein [Polyangium sorediatum]|uniref:STAS/SEC14 domain-containing protein n=1 Tax=Polyangium sorediatum TaxID=889274 RepID=A0ABT6P8S0_9BACT|nr:hypothetical protein [Polyangium sorediatum]MDI1436712.1 hypothetical protein [Polyangium sorediatum]
MSTSTPRISGGDFTDWKMLGTHGYRIESTDIFHVRFAGSVDGSTIETFYDLQAAYAATIGRPISLLVDITKFGEFSTEGRKLSTALDPTGTIAATGIYGGTFRQQMVMNMLTRAGSLLRPWLPPLQFFAHEAEARAFLDACRADRNAREA